MAKKKSARGRSGRRRIKKALPTKFSMKRSHGALKDLLGRLKKVKTPRSERIQKQVQRILDDTFCPLNMVIEL
jgi:hypothetical protein